MVPSEDHYLSSVRELPDRLNTVPPGWHPQTSDTTFHFLRLLQMLSTSVALSLVTSMGIGKWGP